MWKFLGKGKFPYLAKHENCQSLLDTKSPELAKYLKSACFLQVYAEA